MAGVGGLASGLAGWLLGAFVLFAAPGRRENRRLGLVLFLEGATGWAGGCLVFLSGDASTGFAAQATADVCFGSMLFAYVAFLATLNSPLTRPLRGRTAASCLAIGAFMFTALFLWRTDLFLAGVGPSPYGGYWPRNGPFFLPLLLLPSVAVFLFGLVAALSMWHRAAPGTASRRQAATYAVAFGIRDVAWLTFLLDAFVLQSGILPPYAFNGLLLAFQATLAYGMLKHQLFDVDLRIKWTLSRGALAGTFLGTMLVVSKLTESWAEQLFGTSWVLGAVVAGLLLFALAPLQRLADRLADTAMPRVRDTAEYRLVRKREVYRAAVESALQDGFITERERDVLATLAEELGLGPAEARAIERDALPAGTGGASLTA